MTAAPALRARSNSRRNAASWTPATRTRAPLDTYKGIATDKTRLAHGQQKSRTANAVRLEPAHLLPDAQQTRAP